MKHLFCLLLLIAGTSAHAEDLDGYGGFTDIKGEKTGFFHTQKIDDRWWLVTPDGHGFFGIGLSHPVTSFSEGAVTFAYNGKPMHLEFSMTIGDPLPIGPIGAGVVLLLALGIGVTVVQRRRAMTGKVRAARDRHAS